VNNLLLSNEKTQPAILHLSQTTEISTPETKPLTYRKNSDLHIDTEL